MALVFKRTLGEAFVILTPEGKVIRVTLRKVRGQNGAVFVIEAPDDVRILREEVLKASAGEFEP